jgi:hypothetical protein
MPEKLNREDVRKEAERIDMFDKGIDHKVKGVDEKLAQKYTLDTIRLADKIERAEIHDEDKQQLLKEIKTELSTLKTKRSLKKREKDFNNKLKSWLTEVGSSEKLRGELTKFIEENEEYLPLEKIAGIDAKKTPTKELKALKEDIEVNKKEFEDFKEIQKILPEKLDEAFLHVCFIKYLSNGKKPQIQELIKGLKEAKKQQEQIIKVQLETIKLAKDFKEIKAPKDRNLEQQELTMLLAEIVNTKDVKGSIQKLELEKALDQEKKNQEKVKKAIKMMEAEKEMREAKDKKEILKKQLRYFELIQEDIAENAKEAEKSFSELLAETDDKDQQKLYLTQLVAIKKDSRNKYEKIQKQIENVSFAIENFDAEKDYINELIDTNKTLSKEAKEFASKKAEFLGEKIKDLKEREEGIEEKRKRLVEQSKGADEEKLTNLHHTSVRLVREEIRIKTEKKYLELEQKAAKNKFEPKEWADFLKENREKNPDLAKKARLAINLYTPRYLKNLEPIKNVKKNLLPLHSNLGRIYGLLDTANDRNLSQEVLDDWNKTLGEAKDEFLQKEMWKDVQRGGREILSMIELFKAKGLNASDPIMETLRQMKVNYENLQSLYGHDQCEFIRLTEKISELEADTAGNHITHFLETEGVIIGGAVVGATLFAIPGGMVAGAAGLGAVSEFILVSTCAGVGMTLGTEVSKPMIGMVPDFSLKNLAYSSAKNTAMSMAFMGAGKLIGREIEVAVKAGTAGRATKGIYWAKQGLDKAWGKVKGVGANMANRNAVARYMTGNIFQEGGEEFTENWAQKADPMLGLIASTFNAMDGINVNVDLRTAPALKTLSQEAEVSIRSINGNKVVFEYNPANKQILIDKITQSGGMMINKGSVLTCEFKQGNEIITYKFLPSKVSFKTRQFLATDLGKSLEQKFKLKFSDEGTTTYEGSTKRLQSKLEAEGFVCLEMEGRIVAVRDKEKVVFVPKAKKPDLGEFVGELAQSAKGLFLKPSPEFRSMSRAHRGNEAALASLAEAAPSHVLSESAEIAGSTIESVMDMPGLTLEEKKFLIEMFPEGIENSHIEQQNVGDCHFLATLHAAKRNPIFPYFFAKRVKRSPDGKSWEVTLRQVNSDWEFENLVVTVTEEELEGGMGLDERTGGIVHKRTVFGQTGDKILEIAVAKQFQIERKVEHHMNAIEGGNPIITLATFFEDVRARSGKAWNGNGPLSLKRKGRKKQVKIMKGILREYSENPDSYILTTFTPTDYRTEYYKTFNQMIDEDGVTEFSEDRIYYMDPELRFVTNHAYSIVGVDPKAKTVTIANPHGTREKVHTITYKEFANYFCSLTYLELDTKKIEDLYGETRLMGKPHEEGTLNTELESGINYKYSIPNGAATLTINGTRYGLMHTWDDKMVLMNQETAEVEDLFFPNSTETIKLKGNEAQVSITYMGNGELSLRSLDGAHIIVDKATNDLNIVRNHQGGEIEYNKTYEYDLSERSMLVEDRFRRTEIKLLTTGEVLVNDKMIKPGEIETVSFFGGVRNLGNGKIVITNTNKQMKMTTHLVKPLEFENVKGDLQKGRQYVYDMSKASNSVVFKVGKNVVVRCFRYGHKVRVQIERKNQDEKRYFDLDKPGDLVPLHSEMLSYESDIRLPGITVSLNSNRSITVLADGPIKATNIKN